MGIYDREYVRMGPRSQSGLGGLPMISVNTWLIVINIAVYFLAPLTGSVDVPIGTQRIVFTDGSTTERVVTSTMSTLAAYGHFSTATAFFYDAGGKVHLTLEVWRLVTFQFLHAGFWHLFFNMFGLWVFGGMVEQFMGRRKYLAYYLTCGIFGGLCYLLLNLLGSMIRLPIPGLLVSDPRTPLVGASAGVFGVIMACAFIAPNAVVQLIFPPIPLKMKWFAYGYVVVAAINLFSGGQNAGGDAAHVGGALAGAFFVRRTHLLGDFFDVLSNSRKQGGRSASRAGQTSTEVDRILDKVRTGGMDSLTGAEKRRLRRESERGRGRA